MSPERTSAMPGGDVGAAVSAIEDLKGRDIMVLDMRGLTDATDYFIVASGTSDAHSPIDITVTGNNNVS